MKKLLTLAIIAIIMLAMQSCTDELPNPEKRQDCNEVYDRIEIDKVREAPI